MAYARRYEGKDGTRYYAMYRNAEGRRTSAGSFSNEAQALRVAQEMEAWTRGRREGVSPAHVATMTIEKYAPIFLRTHSAEAVTIRGYESTLRCHVLPYVGGLRVGEIQRPQIRNWLKLLEREKKLSPTRLRACRSALSALLQMAMEDGYRHDNPARGVTTPRIPRTDLVVMTPDQFGALRKALPTRAARLMATVVVKTGLRFGEVTALVEGDLNYDTRILSVARVASEVGAEYSSDGRSRFEIKPYTKGGFSRKIRGGPGDGENAAGVRARQQHPTRRTALPLRPRAIALS